MNAYGLLILWALLFQNALSLADLLDHLIRHHGRSCARPFQECLVRSIER